jgi:hypothetical protein
MTTHPTSDYDKLMFVLRRALVERRQVIEVGDMRFRFQRRDEEFEDGAQAFRAMESGVFAYFRATSGGREVPGRWLHLGTTDDLEHVMRPYLADFGPRELEELRVTIAANAALQSLHAERAAARRPAATDASLAFMPVAQVPAEFAARTYESNAAPEAARSSEPDTAPRAPRPR